MAIAKTPPKIAVAAVTAFSPSATLRPASANSPDEMVRAAIATTAGTARQKPATSHTRIFEDTPICDSVSTTKARMTSRATKAVSPAIDRARATAAASLVMKGSRRASSVILGELLVVAVLASGEPEHGQHEDRECDRDRERRAQRQSEQHHVRSGGRPRHVKRENRPDCERHKGEPDRPLPIGLPRLLVHRFLAGFPHVAHAACRRNGRISGFG